MILRDATIEDLALLRYWDTKQHVIESDPNDDWDWEKELIRNPNWRSQLVAEKNGAAIGFIQIIDPKLEETHYWGAVEDNLRAIDIWIGEEENLGKGYGTKMMEIAIEKCFDNKEVTAIWVDPLTTNKKAHNFYKKLGFTFKEARQLGEDECHVYELSRIDWYQNK